MDPRPDTQIQTKARTMFTRVLAGWASDLMELRRSGLIVPSAREGSADPVMPDWGGAPSLRGPQWASHDVAGSLKWKPARRAA